MALQSDLLIAVDVGNSRVKFGLFAQSASGRDGLPECLEASATRVDEELPWSTIRGWSRDVANARLAGVVAGANPAGVRRVHEGWPADFGPPPVVIIEPDRFPLRVDLDAPSKVGIDRLLNAVAANRIRPDDTPVVIVDTGTATTVDCVSRGGAFIGGSILPGFELSAIALHRYTALLPLISIDELATQPHDPLGTNTREALRSGLFWGQLGAVRELIERYAAILGGEPQVLLTGGGAALLATELVNAQFLPHLALQGLALVTLSQYDEQREP